MSPRLLLSLTLLLTGSLHLTAAPVTLAKDAQPLQPIIVSAKATAETRQTAQTLAEYLTRIVGAKFAVQTGDGTTGVALGLPGDFPALTQTIPLDPANPNTREDYLLRSQPGGLLILGATPLALQDAAWDLLYRIGYRQFFAGPRWEVVPHLRDITLDLDTHEHPDYLARRIWYGAGLWDFSAKPYDDWCAKNRARSGVVLNSGHSYEGFISHDKAAFAEHPEYLALVNGKRQGPKLCISNPALRRLVVAQVLEQFAKNPELDSASLDPSDGGGWCECPECAKLGSVTDQALTLANEAAAAVNARYPGKIIGMYAYNYHSPPPNIAADPHVVVSVATAFIKGGASLEDLLDGWSHKAARLGIREYYAINPWDRDMPAQSRGSNLAYLQRTIPYFKSKGAEFMSAESEDSWGPNGLGFYFASRLLWDTREASQLAALTEDFLTRAFGPAKEPMREFYRQLDGSQPHPVQSDQLGRMFRALDEARRLELPPEVRARIDDLILYARYAQLYRAYAQAQGPARQAAFEALLAHSFRMRETLLVHTKALYRDLVARDRTVTIPESARWHESDGRTWKPTAPFTDAELQQFLAEGIERHPLTRITFAPVTYSDKLVSAAPLHLPPMPAGQLGPGRGRQTFYTQTTAPQTPLDLKITGGLFAHYRDRGHVHLQLWKLGGASQTGEQETLVADDRSVPPDGQEHPVRLAIPEPGLYRLTLDDGSDETRVEFASPLPLTIKSSEAEPMSSSYGMWKLYFYVPRGTRTVGFFGGEHGEICDSAGRAVFWLNGREPNFYAVDVPEGEDGKLWHIRYARGAVRLLTVPPCLAPTPEQLLLPDEVVAKDAAPTGQ